MHELSIAQSLLDAAVAEARRAQATRVTRLHCRIGDLRMVNGELLAEAFEVVRCGTLCESAELSIERTYLQARCSRCERAFDVRNWDWCCPRCGVEGTLLGGGDELEITSIEAEVDQ